ncbi:hypothetical protein [Burkholderia vietnamiensis]|uniref:hypothetical protein n=1 Tax=Burkholderia vietnamiensis TaxID=60552 RepID=UPI001CF55035|nr:hypothetical protein [Burkholderia vietnamiensis]MCA8228238.1 hypothetical protein [Burkholderia vietnamiensis]
MTSKEKRRAVVDLLGRLVSVEVFDPKAGQTRWMVGPGDRRQGQRGTAIATVGLRHAGGYEVVLKLDSGKIDSFSPMQLFPEPTEQTA